MKKKIISVVGARPNFIKIAPIHRAFRAFSGDIRHLICHTGQHFDENMSDIFFRDLELPVPDHHLGVGGGTHAEQTARIMVEFEKVVMLEKPDLIVVPGDVNSTLACSLVAAKLHIPLAHVEAGLRSFDRSMPEEINRVVTDRLADLLFVTEQSGMDNLIREGIDPVKIHFTGNVMIDSLVYYLPRIRARETAVNLGLDPGRFVLVTLHRPGNVDDLNQLGEMVGLLNALASRRAVVFPVHPRTKANLEKYRLTARMDARVMMTEPMGYLDFLSLVGQAELIITDSGGIQEESTFLGVQCITLRNSTERPVTVDVGTNQLIGTNLVRAHDAALAILEGYRKPGQIPPLWDGKAAERISRAIHGYS